MKKTCHYCSHEFEPLSDSYYVNITENGLEVNLACPLCGKDIEFAIIKEWIETMLG